MSLFFFFFLVSFLDINVSFWMTGLIQKKAHGQSLFLLFAFVCLFFQHLQLYYLRQTVDINILHLHLQVFSIQEVSIILYACIEN